MKRLLVPIDFTETSKSAVAYAIQMAGENGSVTLLHCALSKLDGLLKKPLLLRSSLEEDEGIKKELLDFVEDIKQSHSVNTHIDLKIGLGKISDCILLEADQTAYDAVVMGLRDHYTRFNSLIGSNSINVVRQAQIPIFLIPPNGTYQSFTKVAVASDWHLTKDRLIKKILDWNEPYGAFLHFLHIENGNKDAIAENIIEEFGLNDSLYSGFEWSVLPKSDIAETVLKSSDELNCELIILFHDRRLWLVDVLRQSVSHQVILNTKKPILVMPSDQEITNPLIGHIFSVAI